MNETTTIGADGFTESVVGFNPTGYSKKKATATKPTSLPTSFGIRFEFSRDPFGFIVKYHVTCAILVLIGGISFMIDPKVVPGRMGMLVTLFLVLANFFSNAQVCISSLFTKCILKS